MKPERRLPGWIVLLVALGIVAAITWVILAGTRR
jgi:hypothetical protein